MLLMIDNYDSFTYNLVQYLGELGVEVRVERNDQIDVARIAALAPRQIVISPGPCTPNEAGICLDLIKQGAGVKPIFGVCLGLQAMGQSFGGEVVRAPVPMHGKVSPINHKARGMFRGINGPLQATRYHSLVVDRDTCPTVFDIEAETDDGVIMALSHRELPVQGVQFHPESIASEHGATILRNFLDLAERWQSEREASALTPSA